MNILVIAEHHHGALKNTTLHTVEAVKKLAKSITILVYGHGCIAIAETCQKIQGVSRVIRVDHACYAQRLAENSAKLIQFISGAFDAVFAGSSTFSKNVLPRAAALCNESMLSEVCEIIDANTFVRPIYAGNVLLTVEKKYKKLFASIRCPSFPIAELTQENSAPIETRECIIENAQAFFASEEATQNTRPDLTDARIVIAGGRGLKNKENFKLIEDLADQLGAAVGASRAAVDAGFAPNDYQVGQTGKTIAPELYIAIGISGAIQHVAGIKDSQIIVAINNDKDAPIFQIADCGMVGDLFSILPEIQAALKNRT